VDKILNRTKLPFRDTVPWQQRDILRLALGAAIILLAAYIVMFQSLGSLKHPPDVRGLARLSFSPFGSRVLVIAPHPDDEGLATGGIIQQSLAEHRHVRVVIMLSGESGVRVARRLLNKGDITGADYRAVSAMRIQESRKVVARLGLTTKDLILLGYPDGSLNSLWDHNWDYNRLHTGLNGQDHSPYSFAYQKNAPYCGANVVKNLTAIIKDYKPTTVIYPDTEDDHHDHWAANAMTQYVLNTTGYSTDQYTYLVHRVDFPLPEELDPSGSLDPPLVLWQSTNRWQESRLSGKEEAVKSKALKMYTVPRLGKSRFIDAFVRTNEFMRRPQSGRIMTVKAAPDFGAPSIPYVVDNDPASDTMRPSPGQCGDFNRVSLCRTKNTVYAGLETVGNISDKAVYYFRMRLFNGTRVDRIDMEVIHGTARYLRFAHNSIVPVPGAAAYVLKKRIWVQLPASIFRKKKILMYSVDSSMNRVSLDRTAWQTYQL